MIRDFVRRHPFWSFYGIALIIASSVVLGRMYTTWLFLQETGEVLDFYQQIWIGLREFDDKRLYPNLISLLWIAINRDASVYLAFPFALSPTISAIIISWLGWGTDGLKQLFLRLLPWRNGVAKRQALIAYGIIVLFFSIMTAVYLGITWWYAGADRTIELMTIWSIPPQLIILTMLIGGFIDEGATLEELGWRGYGLPVLMQSSSSPLKAALFLGFLWWAWHLPRDIQSIFEGHGYWGDSLLNDYIPGQVTFIITVLSLSVIITYFFNRTGGSVIPAIMIHGLNNFLGKAIGTEVYASLQFDIRFPIMVAAAVIIVLVSGPELGRNDWFKNSTRAAIVEKPPDS